MESRPTSTSAELDSALRFSDRQVIRSLADSSIVALPSFFLSFAAFSCSTRQL